MASSKDIENRRNRVLELVLENRSITVEGLSASLDISKMTIRRDLSYLLSRGLIQRVHGGASAPRTREDEPPYLVRSTAMMREKRAIGMAAAAMVQKHEVILADIGTTILELVRNLSAELQAEIVTHWLPIAFECAKLKNAKVSVLGGDVNLDELSLTGGQTEEALEVYHADIFFMGVGGISATQGLTDFNMDEIQVKKHMMRHCKKVVVLADHSKFERIGPKKICELSRIHTVVTDGDLPDEQRRALKDAGVNLVVAPAVPLA